MAAPWSAGARLRIMGRMHGSQVVNVLHFATNTVINDPATLEQLLRDLANAVKECVLETLLPAVCLDYTIETIEAQRIAPQISDPFAATDLVSTAGEQGNQGIAFASQLIQIRTGTGGRSGRGRIYAPAGPENAANGGEWDPAQLVLLAAFCACMAGKFIGAGATTPWRMGVLSTKKVGDPPAPQPFDVAFREALSLHPQSIIARMGSRQKNKGS